MLTIERVRKNAPIIILDDIVSELDAEKKNNLIQTIKSLNTQVFFSATDVQTFGNHVPIEHVYHVNNGVVANL